MEGIILKNIDLTNWDGLMQSEKIKEELREFKDAATDYILYNNEESRQHAIEEFFDLCQSGLGLLSIVGISADEAMKYYPKHLEKLKSRDYKPRIKQCSKCINSESSKPYFNGKDTEEYFYCNQFLSKVDEEVAKTCKSYEEK